MSEAALIGDTLYGLSTNPVEHEELYDAYLLGNHTSPGVVTFDGLEREMGWDVKGADGQDGAKTTRKGRVPCKFTATHDLAVDPMSGVDEIADWDAFLPVLEMAQGIGPDVTALDFYHPDAARVHIGAVTVAKIGALKHDGLGGATVKVEYIEYFPPKSKPSTGPSGTSARTPAGAGAGGAQAPDPNAAAKAEIAALHAEALKP